MLSFPPQSVSLFKANPSLHGPFSQFASIQTWPINLPKIGQFVSVNFPPKILTTVLRTTETEKFHVKKRKKYNFIVNMNVLYYSIRCFASQILYDISIIHNIQMYTNN